MAAATAPDLSWEYRSVVEPLKTKLYSLSFRPWDRSSSWVMYLGWPFGESPVRVFPRRSAAARTWRGVDVGSRHQPVQRRIDATGGELERCALLNGTDPRRRIDLPHVQRAGSQLLDEIGRRADEHDVWRDVLLREEALAVGDE